MGRFVGGGRLVEHSIFDILLAGVTTESCFLPVVNGTEVALNGLARIARTPAKHPLFECIPEFVEHEHIPRPNFLLMLFFNKFRIRHPHVTTLVLGAVVV